MSGLVYIIAKIQMIHLKS